jgi:hypothetical protein
VKLPQFIFNISTDMKQSHPTLNLKTSGKHDSLFHYDQVILKVSHLSRSGLQLCSSKLYTQMFLEFLTSLLKFRFSVLVIKNVLELHRD